MVIGVSGAALGLPTNHMVAAVYDPATRQAIVNFFADAATDNATVLLPVFASDLALSSGSPRFSYSATVFDRVGNGASLPGVATFNALNPSMQVSSFPVVAPNAFATTTVTIDPAEWKLTPALGLMVVVQDNRAGERQAQNRPGPERALRSGGGRRRGARPPPRAAASVPEVPHSGGDHGHAGGVGGGDHSRRRGPTRPAG